MIKNVLLYLLCSAFLTSHAQVFSVPDMVDIAGMQKQKQEAYLSKRGFVFKNNTYQGEDILGNYEYTEKIKNKLENAEKITISTCRTVQDLYFIYCTTSKNEYLNIKAALITENFKYKAETDSLNSPFIFYQKNDITIITFFKQAGTIVEYSIKLQKHILPKPKEINFAEDLLAFNSYENLRFYFGDKNVKNDIYYLSENEIVKCSVLFPNSSRQAVFLWDNPEDNTVLSRIYIGGQLNTESALSYSEKVDENIWRLKNGVHTGMTLYSLRRLNEAPFNFYGGNSNKRGLVFADSTGKIDFEKAEVILECLNCNESKFFNQKFIHSDDAIAEEKIIFIHTISINLKKNKRIIKE